MGGLLKGILLNLQPFKRAIFFPSSPGSHSGLAGGAVESFSVCPLHWKPSLRLVLTAAEGWQHRLPCVFAGIMFSPAVLHKRFSPDTVHLLLYFFHCAVFRFKFSALVFALLLTFLCCLSTYFDFVSRYINTQVLNKKVPQAESWFRSRSELSASASTQLPDSLLDFVFFFLLLLFLLFVLTLKMFRKCCWFKLAVWVPRPPPNLPLFSGACPPPQAGATLHDPQPVKLLKRIDFSRTMGIN